MRGLQLSGLACPVEVLGAELPDRLQLPVPGPGGGLLRDHQGLVDQFGQQVQQFGRWQRRVCADRLHRGEGEPAGEHRQPAQQDLLRLGEQVVAPFQRAAQRLVPGDAVGPAAEHGQGIAQPLDDLGRFEHGGPGRGQLQGQRHPVEPSAQVDDALRVVGVERETGPDLRRPLDEEPDRAAAGRARPGRGRCVADGRAAGPMTAPGRCTRPGRAAAPGWWRARAHPGQPASRAATRWAQAASRCSQLSSTISSERSRSWSTSAWPRLGRRAGIQPERLGHRVGHQQRLADRREVDEPHSVGVRRTDLLRGRQRQPGLAAAAGPGEGEQPGPADQPIDVDELTLAADEAGQRVWAGSRSRRCRSLRRVVLVGASSAGDPVNSSRNSATVWASGSVPNASSRSSTSRS